MRSGASSFRSWHGQSSSRLGRRARSAARISRSRTRSRRRGGLDAQGQHRARDCAGRRSAGDGASYETITYEGYGPSGIAVYVEAVTDNRNRTAAEVRHIFTKSDGSLGESGSVAWLFERRAVVLVDGSADEDELILAAAEGGADDIEREGDSWRVVAAPEARAAFVRRSRRRG